MVWIQGHQWKWVLAAPSPKIPSIWNQKLWHCFILSKHSGSGEVGEGRTHALSLQEQSPRSARQVCVCWRGRFLPPLDVAKKRKESSGADSCSRHLWVGRKIAGCSKRTEEGKGGWGGRGRGRGVADSHRHTLGVGGDGLSRPAPATDQIS